MQTPDDQSSVFIKQRSKEWENYRHNKTEANSFVSRNISTTFLEEWDNYRHNKTVANSFMSRNISTTFLGANCGLRVIMLNCFKRREKKSGKMKDFQIWLLAVELLINLIWFLSFVTLSELVLHITTTNRMKT